MLCHTNTDSRCCAPYTATALQLTCNNFLTRSRTVTGKYYGKAKTPFTIFLYVFVTSSSKKGGYLHNACFAHCPAFCTSESMQATKGQAQPPVHGNQENLGLQSTMSSFPVFTGLQAMQEKLSSADATYPAIISNTNTPNAHQSTGLL